MADVELAMHHNPRILAQAPVKEPFSYVDRVDPGCPVLEQAVGKTAGGGSQIGANLPGDRYVKLA